MPEPRKFTKNELRKRLSRVHWHRSKPPSSPIDWVNLIRKTVGANTFRALHPSMLFREWPFEALVGKYGFFKKLLSVADETAYDKWLSDFTENLRDYWQRESGCKISFAHSRKLSNLLMKAVCDVLPEANCKRIVWSLHVPLDSYSVQAVMNSIDARKEIGKTIPQNAMMGFVKDQHIYNRLQKVIRRLAKDANVPPIALDLLAWDEPHKNTPLTKAEKVAAKEILDQVQQHITKAAKGDPVLTSTLRKYIFKKLKAAEVSG